MKRSLCISLIIFALTYTAFGQKLGKPTLTPSPLTAAQEKILNEGVTLHDAKKYAEAIAKYRSILAENPECVAAMYELALSLENKGDKLDAVELAYKGTKYISSELPLFYVLIANTLDDAGKPDDAIKIYRDGLKLLEGETQFGKYRSSLNYNLGVTFVKQKKYNDARQALKSAVADDPLYPSPHYLLAVVFNGTKYKVPGMLAAARLVSLEFNTQRTVASAGVIVDLLKPASKDAKTGNIVINLDFLAPKDEGEFGMYEMLLPTLTTVKDKDDGKKTANQLFIESIGTVITMLGDDKRLKETFVGKHYIPFVVDLKKSGHIDAFGNIVIFINDRNNEEAKRWIDGNETKLRSFLDWAKTYKPATK
ncbi:MAG TPA: tetratricopeptide repeat protein [Pyrinomonadaceae bacterium]|nr:tetratricopeptide repeat protein [Pyrinomonadaceae bacterium]